MTSAFIKRFDELKSHSAELITKIPETMSGFGELHASAMEENALDRKTKELIALGIAIAVHCDGCIAFHVHDALEAGANHQQIFETIGVAVLMGGSPAMVYGCDALQALNEFYAQQNPPL